MESILNDTKKLLGIGADDQSFDVDLIIHINSVFMILTQMGVGPKDGYKITDSTNAWSEFTDDERTMDSVKTYIYLKVRMWFDPPQNSSHSSAIQSAISELEWRLNVANDNT